MPSGPAAYHSRTGPVARVTRLPCAVQGPEAPSNDIDTVPAAASSRTGPAPNCARDAPAPQLPAGPGPPRVKARVRRAQRPGDRRLRGERQRLERPHGVRRRWRCDAGGRADTRRRGEAVSARSTPSPRPPPHRRARAWRACPRCSWSPRVSPRRCDYLGIVAGKVTQIHPPQGEQRPHLGARGLRWPRGANHERGSQFFRRLRLGHRPARSQTGDVMTWTAVANLNTARQGLAVVTAPAPSPASGLVLYAIGGDGGANSNAIGDGRDV